MSDSAPFVTFKATQTESAISLPAIGQGTWFMGENRVPFSQEADALRFGLDCGMPLIDTAEMYAEGGAEKVVGDAIKGRRDDAFIVSKVYPWNAGKQSAIQACEESLARMQIDTIDLYLLHWPGSIELDETFEAFERLLSAGKIRRFGISNFDAKGLSSVMQVPSAAECATNQVLYHLGSRGIEFDLLPKMRDLTMPAMAYCPLAQGGGLRDQLLNSPVVEAIAREHGKTPAQILLAWVIRHSQSHSSLSAGNMNARNVIAIPKAASRNHVQENANALSITLSDEDLARLDKAFPAPISPTPLDIV